MVLEALAPTQGTGVESRDECTTLLIEAACGCVLSFSQASISEKDLHPGPLLAHVVTWKKVPSLGGRYPNDAPWGRLVQQERDLSPVRASALIIYQRPFPAERLSPFLCSMFFPVTGSTWTVFLNDLFLLRLIWVQRGLSFFGWSFPV